jgi:hypothetical protein
MCCVSKMTMGGPTCDSVKMKFDDGNRRDIKTTLPVSAPLFKSTRVPPASRVKAVTANIPDILRVRKKAAANMLAVRKAMPENSCQNITMAALSSMNRNL